MRQLISLLAMALIFDTASAGEYEHTYEEGEDVTLWVNKVGPYHNPQETYLYYSLPFCSTKPVTELEHRYDSFGELLEGNDMISSGLAMKFRQPVADHSKICSLQLNEESIGQLQYAVKNHCEPQNPNDSGASNAQPSSRPPLPLCTRVHTADAGQSRSRFRVARALAPPRPLPIPDWYQLYLDDLPIWGMVGELATSDNGNEGAAAVPSEGEGEPLLYTHKKFNIAFNGKRIIQVNLTSENPVALTPGAAIEFTYTVEWTPTDIPFYQRFHRYLDYDFFEHQIHWFSIFNSFMMVIFLTGIVVLILTRTLKKDFAKIAKESGDLDELDQELDESGWKQVHGEVFRAPAQLAIFCALVGTGSQLACMVFSMILFATATTLYMGRGAIIVSFLVAYCLTSVVAGYTSGSLYCRSGGRFWIRTMLYTASLFPAVCFLVCMVLNFVGAIYGSLATVPFTSVLSVVLMWALVSLPLCVAGTLLGRNWSGTANFPCRVNAIPRAIPEKRWYARPPVLIALGGVLPFGSIFIEMYFVFTSFWNYKFYYVYGFMFLVFLILTIVTVCVTIVVTYFLLNNEDYRWPWTSFAASSSTALYVFAYSVYYFFMKTKMTGFFQTLFYFSYMSLFCLALGIMTGTVGYTGCSIFVTRIYRNIKSD